MPMKCRVTGQAAVYCCLFDAAGCPQIHKTILQGADLPVFESIESLVIRIASFPVERVRGIYSNT